MFFAKENIDKNTIINQKGFIKSSKESFNTKFKSQYLWDIDFQVLHSEATRGL
jgi:hypothetical protein